MDDSVRFSLDKRATKTSFWPSFSAWVIGILLGLCFCFVIAYAFFQWEYAYFTVKGTSMQPFLNPTVTASDLNEGDGIEDAVYVKRHSAIANGDVIIIQLPGKADTIIKRVIAHEGDKVTIRKVGVAAGDVEYRVIVRRAGSTKAEILQESYVTCYNEWSYQSAYTWNGAPYGQDQTYAYEWQFFNTYLNGGQPSESEGVSLETDGLYYTLAEDQIFYLGDNRSVSKDARANGPCNRSQVVGVVKIVVRDVKQAEADGKLWWLKFGSITRYIFGQIGDFFAWNN